MSHSLFLLSCIFAIGISLFKAPHTKDLERKPFFFAPPELIKYFSFGFPDLYADILWIKHIQNIDFCNFQKGKPKYNKSKIYQCEKGWSYKMAEAITELAPRYLKPYKVSGTIMSIIMGDQQGAKMIYDKGIKNFPDDWELHFFASYHYLLELKDLKKGAELLVQAADLGGPLWLYTLAAKTYSQGGHLLLSREVLKTAIKKDSTNSYKKILESKLKAVEKKIRKSKFSF